MQLNCIHIGNYFSQWQLQQHQKKRLSPIAFVELQMEQRNLFMCLHSIFIVLWVFECDFRQSNQRVLDLSAQTPRIRECMVFFSFGGEFKRNDCRCRTQFQYIAHTWMWIAHSPSRSEFWFFFFFIFFSLRPFGTLFGPADFHYNHNNNKTP